MTTTSRLLGAVFLSCLLATIAHAEETRPAAL